MSGKGRLLAAMGEPQRYLVRQSMRLLDEAYDEEQQLVGDEEDGLSSRSSAHYALGLLLRGEPGDRERAEAVIRRVLGLQLIAPGEIYDGTFLLSPDRPHPPQGHMAWDVFPPGIAYALPESMEAVYRQFMNRMEQALPEVFREEGRAARAQECFTQAVNEVLPPVWQSYDPNWREFMACTFALLLEHFAEELPAELTAQIDKAMKRTVAASIQRMRSQSIPMNTNIELMHTFIAQYYGARYGELEWSAHAEREAERLLAEYSEFGSFAEFNSTTYYGVDLTVLGMWRNYAKTERFHEIGGELERGLWRNIAEFYHPLLENMSGPYSRGYEMDMRGHSSIGAFIYLALGSGYEHLAAPNCETSHDPLIALVGVQVPTEVLPQLREHAGNRLVRRQFRELVERDRPGANSHLCTAEAWIGERLMLGGLSGSRNTSGQLHPATAHWQTEDGSCYSLRLLRRMKGQPWSKHMRGVIFDCSAGDGWLRAEVQIAAEAALTLESESGLEVLFEVDGPGLTERTAAGIMSGSWQLPGLRCAVTADAPAPVAQLEGERLAIIYRHAVGARIASRMVFELRFELEEGGIKSETVKKKV